MSKICFYYVDSAYIDYLKHFEIKHRGFSCVPNIEYATNEKFFYGTVLIVDGISYYVPVSSQKKGKQDDVLITDKKGNVRSSLRFNFMIPVPSKLLNKLQLKGNFTDNQSILIKNELAFCRRNIDKINRQAKITYERVVGKVNEKLIHNSCDFKLLEKAYITYCHDNNLDIPNELAVRYNEIFKHNNPTKPSTDKSENTLTFPEKK